MTKRTVIIRGSTHEDESLSDTSGADSLAKKVNDKIIDIVDTRSGAIDHLSYSALAVGKGFCLIAFHYSSTTTTTTTAPP